MNSTAALHLALTEVWFTAERIDAEAVEDQLADLGYEVTPISEARVAEKERFRELRDASTSGLAKRRSA